MKKFISNNSKRRNETNIIRMKQSLLLVLSLMALTVSCSDKDDDEVEVPGIIVGDVPLSDSYLSRLEMPKMLDGGTLFIQHSTKVGLDSVMTYAMEYDLTQNHSRWVAFRFDGLTRQVGSRPSDRWTNDPKLPRQYGIGTGGFQGGVRGQLCGANDRRYRQEATDQTYYMTNSTPMDYDFNGEYWSRFESYINDAGNGIGMIPSFTDTLYVVKGGTIYDENTMGHAYSSGGKAMPIPKYYFIAMLRFRSGKYSAMGFWVEHKDYGRSATNTDLRNAAVTIDYLEKQTGIDFFHNLPDKIENSVEANFSSSEWKL